MAKCLYNDSKIGRPKKNQYSYFLDHMKNAKNGLQKKMIFGFSKCKKVLLMNNDNTKEKKIWLLLQLESLVSSVLILSYRLFSLCGE